MHSHRPLTQGEIKQLEFQGCSSTDWSLISVCENFSPNNILSSTFSGKMVFGMFEKSISLSGGVQKHAGISHSTLHNCILSDNILIENAYIANYSIGENSRIRNISELFVEGTSSFGNGTDVSVLNETGGREVTIFNNLSAQNAYFQALYRHKPILIDQLKKLVADFTKKVSSNMGSIGSDCDISNCGTLKNIHFGDASTLVGVTRLENGSINSTAETPSYVGEGVIAKNFIISAGANVESGASVTNSFVGQAVHLAHYFSAVDSLFFTYCQGEHGEACAAFAGPFTVTHHKSTLLIGGYYSFMNAGSGTNQSNHLYRLGPSHQGIMERGCKTASDSYILWPSRVGAFSLVMGRHKSHADTSELPFSYLVDNAGETYLIPGATLRNIGTIRDAQKWITRDTLKTSNRLDKINASLFTPYTVQKILRAIEVLRSLQNKQGLTADIYNYQGVKINGSSLRKGLGLYEITLTKYLGEKLLDKISTTSSVTFEELIKTLKPTQTEGIDKWIDVSGLIAPQLKVEEIITRIEKGVISDVAEIDLEFNTIHQLFEEYEWNWIVNQLEKRFGHKIEEFTIQDFIRFIQNYTQSIHLFYQNLADDAHKEFAFIISTGSGIDGNEATRKADFDAVRGKFDEHSVVKNLNQEANAKKKIAEQALEVISHFKN
ncbi:MAG: DUF4954 family protein [Bacteroidales bacterium]|nr:DUF4954 family protein [Bacteroidales bacterium]